MKLIFAVDKNYSIGYKGDMLFHISEDLQRFKKLTSGNIVIMGRKTLESLPNSKPLKNRTNIVLSKNTSYKLNDAYVIHSIKEIKPLINKIDPKNEKEVFLIGGAILVRDLYDSCNYAYITEVDKEYEDYDTQIPNIRKDPNWKKVKESNIKQYKGLSYKFVEYQRI